MRKAIVFLSFALFALLSCSTQDATQVSQTTNADKQVQQSNDSVVVSSHLTDKTTAANNSNQNAAPVSKSDTKTKWTQSGESVDVSNFNTEIAKAEKELKIKPKDETAKKNLAESYVKRAIALTDARQYASALGDYRRALKYDPSNEEAKKWIDQITGIYQSMNRQPPKEEEEPPPLPFKKKEI